MPKKSFLRLQDKSLQAYKDWIMGMTKLFKPDAQDTYTEEEWVQRWEKFWSKHDEDGKDDSKAPTKE